MFQDEGQYLHKAKRNIRSTFASSANINHSKRGSETDRLVACSKSFCKSLGIRSKKENRFPKEPNMFKVGFGLSWV